MLILCFKGSFQSLGLTTNGQVYTELFLPLRISRPDFRKLVTFSNSSSWPQISHQQHTIGKSIARSSDKFKRGKRAVPPPRGVLLCGRRHLLPGVKEKIFAQGFFSTAKTGSPYFWQLQCLKPFFWQPGQGEERVKRLVLGSTLVWLVLIKMQDHLLSHLTNQSWNRSQTFANTRVFLCDTCNRKVKLWPGSSFAISWFSRVRSRTGKRSFIGGWAKVVISNKGSLFQYLTNSRHSSIADCFKWPFHLLWPPSETN